jgi:hypothetical protein
MWKLPGQVGKLRTCTESDAQYPGAVRQPGKYPFELKMKAFVNRRKFPLLMFIAGSLLIKHGFKFVLVHVRDPKKSDDATETPRREASDCVRPSPARPPHADSDRPRKTKNR